MKVKIEFDCDNAAFADDFEFEVYAIMRRCADQVLYSRHQREAGTHAVKDTNGNTVGKVSLIEEGD
jgi:hypothetical protein